MRKPTILFKFLFFALSFFIFHFSFFIFLPSPALAADPCRSLIEVGGKWYEVVPLICIEYYISRTINFLFPIAAAVALFFLLWGAIKFVLSGGDPKNVEAAKKTLTYALFGLAIIFGVWLIFKVIEQLTGLNLTKYEIYYPEE